MSESSRRGAAEIGAVERTLSTGRDAARDRRAQVQAWVEQPRVRNTILAVILANAVLLGMETSAALMAVAGDWIVALDRVCLAFFVVEITIKLYALRLGYFRSGWNVFDFVIVGIALVPAAHALSVLRAMRILRLLRVLSVEPSFASLNDSLPHFPEWAPSSC